MNPIWPISLHSSLHSALQKLHSAILRGPVRGILNTQLKEELKLQFGWRIAAATLLSVLGASLGSVGGLGGGGIFVPTMIVVLGFDAKTAPALSKCMIMAQSLATLAYIIRRRQAASKKPVIDYELAVLFQPMLLLGISIGVICNLMFPDWLITLLVILFSTIVSVRSCYRGIITWQQETQGTRGIDATEVAESFCSNIRWRECGILSVVWFSVLILQMLKEKSEPCSQANWTYNLLQIPVALVATFLQARHLHKKAVPLQQQQLLHSEGQHWSVSTLCLYPFIGILAGILAGLLGSGGGKLVGPALMELGATPQVASSTAIFVMSFSSSMAVIEYYLLGRFPVSYAIYFGAVCMLSAVFGQHALQKLVRCLGRTSIIVFALVFLVMAGGVSMGVNGALNVIDQIRHGEYMGFRSPC